MFPLPRTREKEWDEGKNLLIFTHLLILAQVDFFANVKGEGGTGRWSFSP